jgi:serine/threonine protein kinase
LIDFGIALAADETRMTKSGYAIGTFQYIAPERLGTRAEEDARADVYSLACVLYECLTGHPPFDAATMAGLVAAHLNTPPPQPSATQPNVPAQIDHVIATGMAKDPDNRYATTVELADAARDAITVPIPALAPPPQVAPVPPPQVPSALSGPPTAPGPTPVPPPTPAWGHVGPPPAFTPAAVSPTAPTQQQPPGAVPQSAAPGTTQHAPTGRRHRPRGLGTVPIPVGPPIGRRSPGGEGMSWWGWRWSRSSGRPSPP